MDLSKILVNVENNAELIKQIEAEIGKEYVPRTEFNTKNEALKAAEKQLGELNTSMAESKKASEEAIKTIEELTAAKAKYELSSLKTRIAHEKGIPYDLVDRLQGEDEKSIGADANKLAELLNNQKPPQPEGAAEPNRGEEDAYKQLLQGIEGE